MDIQHLVNVPGNHMVDALGKERKGKPFMGPELEFGIIHLVGTEEMIAKAMV